MIGSGIYLETHQIVSCLPAKERESLDSRADCVQLTMSGLTEEAELGPTESGFGFLRVHFGCCFVLFSSSQRQPSETMVESFHD